MKSCKQAIALIALVLAGVGNAWAWHRGHGHVGVYVGPYWGPGYYGSPYYYPPYPTYYPPVVVQRADPPVYIQQAPQPEPVRVESAPQAGYWYYCVAAKAYYPYVKECPAGWQKVAPQPER